MSTHWSKALVDVVAEAVADDPEWEARVGRALSGCHKIHLAIFTEPYLGFILTGQKTIESRFAKKPIDPYQAVREGDVLLLKRTSGPVVGICRVSTALFFELDDAKREALRERYAEPLCATTPAFWEERRDKKFATLMQIEDVRELPNLTCGKRDRRGWVTLAGAHLLRAES